MWFRGGGLTAGNHDNRKPKVNFVAEITIVIQVTRLKRKSTVNFAVKLTIVIDVTTVTIVKLINVMCKITIGTLLAKVVINVLVSCSNTARYFRPASTET